MNELLLTFSSCSMLLPSLCHDNSSATMMSTMKTNSKSMMTTFPQLFDWPNSPLSTQSFKLPAKNGKSIYQLYSIQTVLKQYHLSIMKHEEIVAFPHYVWLESNVVYIIPSRFNSICPPNAHIPSKINSQSSRDG